MKTWLAHHYAGFLLALRRLAATPFDTTLSMVAIGIGLTLPAGGYLLLDKAAALAHHAAPKPQVTVFAVQSADARALDTLLQKLRAADNVRDVVFLPKEATLNRMKSSGEMREALEVLGKNPFSDAFAVSPQRDDADSMETLANQLRALPKVEHVQLDAAWIKRLDVLLKVGRNGVGVLAVLLAIGLVAITFNLIRLQVLTSRAEIDLSSLLGATDAYIRRPYLYYGSLLGILGGLAACGMLFGAGAWLSSSIAEAAGVYGASFTLTGLGIKETLFLLAIGGTLGWCGAVLSVQQQLRQ